MKKSVSMSKVDLNKLIELTNVWHFDEDYWFHTKPSKVKGLISKGYLKTKVELCTTVIKIDGKLSSKTEEISTEYQIKDEYFHLVEAEHKRLEKLEKAEKEKAWKEKTQGVPKDVVNKGNIAIKHWRMYEERLSKSEIESIIRDLGNTRS